MRNHETLLRTLNKVAKRAQKAKIIASLCICRSRSCVLVGCHTLDLIVWCVCCKFFENMVSYTRTHHTEHAHAHTKHDKNLKEPRQSGRLCLGRNEVHAPYTWVANEET